MPQLYVCTTRGRAAPPPAQRAGSAVAFAVADYRAESRLIEPGLFKRLLGGLGGYFGDPEGRSMEIITRSCARP
ncbi:hypothetical protein [Streptomyces sp. NPDC002851]